jgi:phosphate uptake regulator
MMASFEKERKKLIAEESLKTRKAREKLKKQLDAFEKKITPQALEKKAIEIQRWIARHASNRVALKSKSISLFDENQNAAGLSQRVGVLADQIKKDFLLGSEDDGQQRLSKLKKMLSKS